MNLEELRKKVHIEKEGITAFEIIKIAKVYGLTAEGYKNYELINAKFPFIALLLNENNTQHFVVVLKVLKDKILVADPLSTVVYVTKKEFERRYTKIGIEFKSKTTLIKEILKQKKLVILISIITLFLSLLSIFLSYIFSFLIENYKTSDFFIKILLCFLFLSIFKEVINYIRQKLSIRFELHIEKTITIPILQKLINLPHDFYQLNSSGELISKVNDLSYIKEIIYKFVQYAFIDFILIISVLAVLIYIDLNLFIFNMVFILIVYLLFRHYIKNHFYETYDLQMKNEKLNSEIVDTFSGIAIIKNLSKENFFEKRIFNSYKHFLDKYKKILTMNNRFSLIFSLLILLMNIAVFSFLLLRNSSVSKIIFIFSLEEIITGVINNTYGMLPLYTNFKSTWKRVNKIYEYENKTELGERLFVKDITFKNICFKINDKLVLNNINLRLKKNEWVMITGDSGKGKTTLFKILTKQIANYSGKIYINGIDIKNIDQKEIISDITFVDQKSRLFNFSVKDNILFDKDSFGKVLETCFLKEYIKNNNIGLDFIIDNMNANISGGEQQKILIAQALLSNGNIIIFDETTSQLDINTERKILLNIKKNYADKTIILISHRTQNYDLFDKIYMIKDKKVIERRNDGKIK